jgi:hypothetical protein
MEWMKPHPEMVEGPEAWARFQGAMKRILAVPHAEIQRRIEEHRKEAAQNPNRRGPKKRPKS